LKLGHEFVHPQEIELENLGGDFAGGGLIKGGAGDHFWRFGLGLREGDDFQETLTKRGDADLVEGKQGLDGEDKLGARDRAINDERVFGGGQRGGAQNASARVKLERGEDAIDG